MKKIKKSLGIYTAVLLLAVINYACCGDTNFRIIGNAYISAFDIETSSSFQDDQQAVITGPFNLTMTHQTEAVAGRFNLNLVSASYATSCPQTFENDMDASTLSVMTDRSFIYDGMTVEAGTNLASIESLERELNWDLIFLNFDENFMNQAQFSNEVYAFTIEVMTTDGIMLSNSMEIRFQLN